MASEANQQEEIVLHVPEELKLKCVEGPSASTVYETKSFRLTVGRTKRSTIHLKDGSVSEQHAEICWAGQAGWALRDVGSSNGTRVNGVALEPLGAGVSLHDGDTIVFGIDSKVMVQLSPAPGGLSGLSMEQLLRAHQEACVQALQAEGCAQVHALRARCDAALITLAAAAAGGEQLPAAMVL